jgi:hypothetical protein
MLFKNCQHCDKAIKPINGSRYNRDANARLIAAAPDMLSVLHRVDAIFSRLQATKEEAEFFIALDAAIAKATTPC